MSVCVRARTHARTQRVHRFILVLVHSLCFLKCLKMQSLNFCSGCLLPASPAVMDSLFGTLKQNKLFYYLLLDITFYYRNTTQPTHSFILNFASFSFLKKKPRGHTLEENEHSLSQKISTVLGISPSLNGDWWALSSNHSHCECLSAVVPSFPEDDILLHSSLTLTSYSFPLHLPCRSLSLLVAGGGCDIDVTFVPEHFTDDCPLHLDWLSATALTIVLFIKKLLWWDLKAEWIYGYRDLNLENHLVLCPIEIEASSLMSVSHPLWHGSWARFTVPAIHFFLLCGFKIWLESSWLLL